MTISIQTCIPPPIIKESLSESYEAIHMVTLEIVEVELNGILSENHRLRVAERKTQTITKMYDRLSRAL